MIFLGKPFNDQELGSAVRNLLGLKSREKEVEKLNAYITESVLKRYLPPTLISERFLKPSAWISRLSSERLRCSFRT